MTRDDIVRLIGSCLDYPSVYMGGASQQSMRKAKRILEALAASGYAVVPVEATGEMLVAGRDAIRAARSSGVGGQTIGNSIRMECYREAACWRAMISAAQEDSHE